MPEAINSAEGPDPFVELLEWIINRTGETPLLRVIDDDTLRLWRAGRYPKERVSGAVKAVDSWAREVLPGKYPPPGVPPGGLRSLAGRQAGQPLTDLAEQPRPSHVEQAEAAAAPLAEHNSLDSGSAVDEAVPSMLEKPRNGWLRGRAAWLAAPVLLLLALLLALKLVPSYRTSDRPGPGSVLYARNAAPVPVRECPALKCRAVVVPTGTRVDMVCFRDAEEVDLNYSSPRWFNIVAPDSDVRGWVHSSQVSHQTRVGLC